MAFFRGIYLKMVEPCNLVKLELCKNISKNFVSNIHNFFFHFICDIISFLKIWDEIHPFFLSFIHCYLFHPTFIYVSIFISIHMYMKNYTYFAHTTLTSVVSSGTATEWILFFPVHPPTHPSGMVRWWGGGAAGSLWTSCWSHDFWLYTDYRYLPIRYTYLRCTYLRWKYLRCTYLRYTIPTVLFFKNRRCRYRSRARHFGTSIGVRIG